MIEAIILGCGALGSNLALELARKAFSTTTRVNLLLVDFDVVEARNLAAQAFLPKHLGMPKVDAVADLVNGFQYTSTKTLNTKLTEDNLTDFVENLNTNDLTIVLDCFDNVEARLLSWKLGQVLNVPTIHASLSEKGTGLVSWTFREYDTFPLSPKNISPSRLKEIQENTQGVKLLPCELNGFRSLTVNTAIAAANALFIYLGINNSNLVPERLVQLGFKSNWFTSNTEIRFLEEISF